LCISDSPVYVVDMVLRVAGGERDEFEMYLTLLEKLYQISLKALPPQSYGEFEVYEMSEDELRKILEVGSAVFLGEKEVYEAAIGGRLEELRRKVEAIMREKEKIRWKPQSLVKKGLTAKLGSLEKKSVEPGGGYYVAYVDYMSEKRSVYGERLLIRLPTPLSRSRNVPEALYREGEVDWDLVVEQRGEVKEDEKEEIYSRIQSNVWISLNRYLGQLSKYIPLGEVSYKVREIYRASVEGVATVAADTFDDAVRREVKRSRNIQRTEMAAVNCVKRWLAQMGYNVEEDYYSGPRPFDMVVSKGGERYVVEVKGKWVGARDDPISFTANEIDFASRFSDRYIICVVYVDENKCVEGPICQTFREFLGGWKLETVRGIEYKYNAWRERPSEGQA